VSIEERILNIVEEPIHIYWHDRPKLRAIALEVRKLEDRIKRLEEGGDEAIYPFEYAARVRIWTEAKEAKP
jgi:hypothetical protein